MKSCIFILFVFIGINISGASNVKPSNQRIEKFVSEQGFFQNTVNAITTDTKGFLWIATSNGLVRYDGYSFEYFYHNYKNTHSIPSNTVKQLLKGSDGKIWIGTQEGLVIYCANREQFIPIECDVRNETVIKEGFGKRVWIAAGAKLQIFKSDNNFPEPVKKIASINLKKQIEGCIVDIEFLSDSALLVATSSAIYKLTFDENQNFSFKVSLLNYELHSTAIRKIIKDENIIWIGTSDGIFKTLFEKNRLTPFSVFFNAENQSIGEGIDVLSMFIDKEQNLWIGTTHNGILKYDNRQDNFVSYQFDSKNNYGLTSNRINCFYEDEYGIMWIGTAQGGLNKLDKNQKTFQNYAHNPYDDHSLSSNLITDITEDKNGRIWLSFFDNTICRINTEINLSEGHRIQFERLEKPLSRLKNKIIVRIFQDEKGFWWIGTSEGLYLYDEQNNHLTRIQLKLGEEIISTAFNRVITQTDANHILIGGRKVFLLNNPWEYILKKQPVALEHSLFDVGENNTVNDFLDDNFGNFWFATRNGVFRLKEENGRLKFKNHITTKVTIDSLALSHNNIFSIHKNRNKDIWLSTFGGGLMKIQLNPAGEPESIKSYHKEDGLPDEAVYGILEDNEGKFWISTDMGICRFDPITEKFEVYDVNDGIANNNFRQSAFLQTSAGIMLMGGLNGLTVFNPNQITKNPIPPKVLISRLKINDQTVVAGKKLNNKVVLNNLISATKELVLDFQNRNISLDIIVQHNSAPNKNKLSYMLQGVNPNWVEVEGGKATATYTNLSPGTYTFLYKGANGDGIWTPNASQLSIQVLAPWYLRWWSLAIFACFVLLIVYGVFSYLVRLEKLKQKLKFEQLDKERVHEMDQAKLRFFTNISHEFKTPLSLIMGPLEKIEEKNNDKGNTKYFSIIQNNILRMQRLVEQLISYRKAETGHLELKYNKTTLGNFIYPLLEAFEENATRVNINFYHKIIAPNRQIIIDVEKTERILLNLFSNAIKFTEKDGEISIEAGFKDGENGEVLFFKMSDTGIGIAPEKIDKIFDRFYRAVDDRGNWGGTGIGLALCKSLSDLMKGNILVESIPDEKTTFELLLPFDERLNVEVKGEINKHRKIAIDWIREDLDEIQDETENTELHSLLIIDDEADIRAFLYEAFKNKYRITLAVDGQDGLEKLKKNQPQLVISDVMMPKLDGYKVCENIKSNPDTCHIPVILLTALDTDAKKLEGLELGADAYIIKPFSIKQLEVRVKKLIENKQRIIEHFTKNSGVPEAELAISERDRKFIKKVIALIEENMSDSSFGVEELAGEASMSTSYFYRRLKQLTGQVPNVYLRNYRLQKAAKMLKECPDLNANEVMYQIGIESPSYFSTAFKKLHGVSPSEYIKKKK